MRFLNVDVKDLFNTSARFDAIVLDVDNGPEPISSESNRNIYSSQGLRSLMNSLNPNGIALIWSGTISSRFEQVARDAGFIVSRRKVDIRDGHVHFIYVLQTTTV